MLPIFLTLHLIASLLVLLLVLAKILKVHKYMFFVALFIPVTGLIILLILHFQILFDADDSAEIGVEKLKLESELYKSVTLDDKKIASSTVPIEEALIVNSARERRSIIMNVLNDNPKEYIEFLQKAGNNDDTEVVHYAVTAMVEISKENDYTLQKLERDYSLNPDNREILTEYTDFVWSCLSQSLMQGQVEVMNRELYSSLMQKKTADGGSVTDYVRMITNELKRHNFTQAGEYIKKMEELYSSEEEYLMIKLRYFAAMGRGDDVKALLEEIEDGHVYLSPKSKEELAFWKS